MTEENNIEWGESQHFELARKYLNHEIHCLHLARESFGEPDSDVELALKGFLWSTVIAAQSFDVQGARLDILSAYVQARVVFETALNGCFVCAEGAEEAKRAIGYAMQKVARNAKREIELRRGTFNIEHSQSENIWNDPRTKELLDQFTNKKGKEIRQWTPNNIVERIEAIEERNGTKNTVGLRFAFFTIYSDASEVIHGSYYGTLIGLGASRPGSGTLTEKEVIPNRIKDFVMLYLILGGVINDLIGTMAHSLDYEELDNIRTSADDATEEFAQIGISESDAKSTPPFTERSPNDPVK